MRLKKSEAVDAGYADSVSLYQASNALVIGIDGYREGWPRLSNAVRDARLVADELEKQGFSVDFREDLSGEELEKAFKEFFILKGQDENARLMVWFAGHGHTLDGEGFLVAADTPRPENAALFKYKALSMRRFGELTRLARSKHVMAVFDSCFSGTIFTTQRALPPAAVTRATTLPVRQFLASGDSDQTVSDDGTFRKLFLRAIRGEERADANCDGYLTGSELGLFLTDRVTNLTSSSQTPRYGKLRDPDYDRGDFVFVLPGTGGGAAPVQPPAPVSAGPAYETDREAIFWESVKDSDDPEALLAYLKKYPNGAFAPLAKIRLKRLTPEPPVKEAAHTKKREPRKAEWPPREAPSEMVLPAFGSNRLGDQDLHPRLVADVNGDGRDDAVAFASNGVFVALSNGAGFDPPTLWSPDFGSGKGWRSGRHLRFLADVTGDGKADVVGFREHGVWVAVSTGRGFGSSRMWVSGFTPLAGGWQMDKNPRFVADVNGDKKADVVGFGSNGVYVSLSTGSSFTPGSVWVAAYGDAAGGWQADKNPRCLADVNGDRKADVVGFGSSGVYVSLSTGASFTAPSVWVPGYGYAAGGWQVDKNPRSLADVNGDGRADVVGFGSNGVYVSLSTGRSFTAPAVWVSGYGFSAGGWQVRENPRVLADVNGDRKADIVGFGSNGVYLSLSTGTAFLPMALWVKNYGLQSGGWTPGRNARYLADVNGDGQAEIVGFGQRGLWTSHFQQ